VRNPTATSLIPQLRKLLAGFSTWAVSMPVHFMWISGEKSGIGHASIQAFQFLLSINIPLIIHTHLKHE